MKIPKNLEPIISGLSAAIVIGVLGFLTLRTSAGIWLMFSFGATVFIVFVLYNLETAQPKKYLFWTFGFDIGWSRFQRSFRFFFLLTRFICWSSDSLNGIS